MVYEFDTLTNEKVSEYKSVWYYFLESESCNSFGSAWSEYKKGHMRKRFYKATYIADEPIPHTVYEYKGVRYVSRNKCAKVNNISRFDDEIKEVELC